MSFGKNGFKVVRQTEGSECGIACLCMLLCHFGSDVSLEFVKRSVEASARGYSLAQLRKAFEAFGLVCRPVSIDLNELRDLRLPAVIHMHGVHFCVLTEIKRGEYWIADPAIGMVKMKSSEMSEAFTGIAMEISKSDDFVPKLEAKEGLLDYAKRLGRPKGFLQAVVVIAALTLIIEVLVLSSPLLIRFVVDRAVNSSDLHLLAAVCFGYFLVYFFQVFTTGVREYLSLILGSALAVAWTKSTFRNLLFLPDRYFRGRESGDILSRFNGIHSVESLVSASAIDAIFDGFFAAFTLVMLYMYDIKMASIALLGIVVYIVIKIGFVRRLATMNLMLVPKMAKKESVFLDCLKTQFSIRLANAQVVQAKRYGDITDDVASSLVRLNSLQSIASSLGLTVLGTVRVMVIYFGGTAVVSGSMTAGMLVAFLAYLEQFSGRCSKLVDYGFTLKFAKVHIARLRDITDSSREEGLFRRSYLGDDEAASVELESVSFSYGANERVVISGASMYVRAGETVAIVGPSGCGKSTLMKIAAGVLDPESGLVKFNNVPIRTLGKMAVRDFLSFAGQEDEIFFGTIAENISFHSPGVDYERLQAVSVIVGLDSVVNDLPMRYETTIGGGGSSLSGGQVQRVLIARAIYRMPKILFLDEATSSLDVLSERSILSNLRRLGMTVVLSAHRPEAIGFASRVYKVDGGALSEARP